jgi:hypothetical protein
MKSNEGIVVDPSNARGEHTFITQFLPRWGSVQAVKRDENGDGNRGRRRKVTLGSRGGWYTAHAIWAST